MAEDTMHEQVKKARAEQIKNNEEKMTYDAKQRPTPSPDEMIATTSGKPMEKAEPHGAHVQNPNDPPHLHLDPHKRKAATAEAGHDATYQTRASTTKAER